MSYISLYIYEGWRGNYVQLCRWKLLSTPKWTTRPQGTAHQSGYQDCWQVVLISLTTGQKCSSCNYSAASQCKISVSATLLRQCNPETVASSIKTFIIAYTAMTVRLFCSDLSSTAFPILFLRVPYNIFTMPDLCCTEVRIDHIMCFKACAVLKALTVHGFVQVKPQFYCQNHLPMQAAHWCCRLEAQVDVNLSHSPQRHFSELFYEEICNLELSLTTDSGSKTQMQAFDFQSRAMSLAQIILTLQTQAHASFQVTALQMAWSVSSVTAWAASFGHLKYMNLNNNQKSHRIQSASMCWSGCQFMCLCLCMCTGTALQASSMKQENCNCSTLLGLQDPRTYLISFSASYIYSGWHFCSDASLHIN